MRRLRVLGDAGTNFYHVVSRVVDRRFVFGEAEKRHFRHLLRRLLAFSGIRCVTFCLMDNHFHLLLEVPDDDGNEFVARATPEDVFARVAMLYGPEEFARIRAHYAMLGRTSRSGGAAGEYLKGFTDRMYCLSTLMKELKGRFSQWYNRRASRKGTLWEERFRSVLCEGSRGALVTVAAYIDLNPVRAGLVEDPLDFRWCGYGEAVAGEEGARRGLQRALLPGEEGRRLNWKTLQADYRVILFGFGGEVTDEEGRLRRRGLSRRAIQDVIDSGGELTMAQILRCQVRVFCEGMAIGSGAFVESFFRSQSWRFGARKKRVAQALPGCGWGDLRAAQGGRGGGGLEPGEPRGTGSGDRLRDPR